MTIASHDAIVIGAGVVGLSTALYLQRAGRRPVVVDALGPAGGTSFGNAGIISPESAVPIALPGMLRKVPGWLRDPSGPLVVRPRYLPKALPWLRKWIKAGQLAEVLKISDAMQALHHETYACWQELLGPALYHDLIRPLGYVRVWEGDAKGRSARVEERIRERHGFKTEPLSIDDLRQMFPGISRDVTRGVLVPGNGFTVSPQRLVQALAHLFVAAGGEIIAERVLKLIPNSGAPGYLLMTNLANRSTRTLVVAAGAWSNRLLEPIGAGVALETERGYHAMFLDPGVSFNLPINDEARAFFITPMEDGLRIAGTVEIAGLDAPPDERRAKILVAHAKHLFPDLRTEKVRYWMGFRPSTPDSLPFLGPAPGHEGLFLAFGNGHFGMTGGPPSARLVARLITGEAPGIDVTPYRPQRFR